MRFQDPPNALERAVDSYFRFALKRPWTLALIYAVALFAVGGLRL